MNDRSDGTASTQLEKALLAETPAAARPSVDVLTPLAVIGACSILGNSPLTYVIGGVLSVAVVLLGVVTLRNRIASGP